jgi:hypothetical protein
MTETKGFFFRELGNPSLRTLLEASIFYGMDICRPVFPHVSLALCLLFAACSTTPIPAVRPPDVEERAVFGEMSAFYCKQQRWPVSWDEFLSSERGDEEAGSYVSDFLNPKLESPRAILLTLRYTNPQGVDRKVTFIAPPDCGESTRAEEVSIAGGRVTFSLPKRFVVLDAKVIKAKWKEGPYPDVAWQDSQKGIFVTVSFGEVQVEPGEMEEFKVELEDAYEGSVPKLQWVEKRLEDVGGSPELVHEFISESSNGVLVSYLVSRSFDGRQLSLSVAGPGDRQSEVEGLGGSIRDSLRVR